MAGGRSEQEKRMRREAEEVQERAAASEREARRNWAKFKELDLQFDPPVDYEWLDREFEHKGGVHHIVGLVSVSGRVLIVCTCGDRFARMSAEFVKQRLCGVAAERAK